MEIIHDTRNALNTRQIAYRVNRNVLSDGSETFDAKIIAQQIAFTDERQMRLFCEKIDVSMAKNKAFVGMAVDTEIS